MQEFWSNPIDFSHLHCVRITPLWVIPIIESDFFHWRCAETCKSPVVSPNSVISPTASTAVSPSGTNTAVSGERFRNSLLFSRFPDPDPTGFGVVVPWSDDLGAKLSCSLQHIALNNYYENQGCRYHDVLYSFDGVNFRQSGNRRWTVESRRKDCDVAQNDIASSIGRETIGWIRR